jgi:hypothetical protein
MHNKLQYTGRGDYCEHMQPAQLSILTSESSSVSPGTTSMIRFTTGPRRIQQNYLVSDVRLRRKERATMMKRARESSTTWEVITVRERADTASSVSEREQTPPVQGSRVSRHRQSRVRERADTASSGFEREPTTGLRHTLAGEAALVHRTG